ncbi:hypothetical protein [Mycolicibacterium sp.]|uniref:hypothetical protein n=1 Tax=Mycolicibacterium sp. TaxID=2320850 RepID=UPI003D108A14
MPTRARTRAQTSAAHITRQRRLNHAQRPHDIAAYAAQHAERTERARQAATRTKQRHQTQQPKPPPPTPQPPPHHDHDDDPPPF